MTPSGPTQPQTSSWSARAFDLCPPWQLSTIREMLGTLDTLTTAGQRHIMTKVVSFIRDNGNYWAHRIGHSDEGLVGDLLGRLAQESQRLAPDPRRFGQQAQDLVDLLAGASRAAA